MYQMIMVAQGMIHLGDFFRSSDSKSFEAAFIRWVRSFQLDLEYKVVVLDGKPQEEALIKMESLCIWLALLPVNLA